MVVHGGIDQLDNLTNSLQVFDTSRLQWVKIIANYKTLPVELHAMAFACQSPVYQTVQDLSAAIPKFKPKANEGLYIFGGRDENGNAVGHFWRYKLLTNPWLLEDVQPMAIGPSARFGHCLSYLSTIDCLVVFGGDNGTTCFNDVFLFNIELGHWVDLHISGKYRPVPRTMFSWTSYSESRTCRLFILGGMAANNFAGGTILSLEFEDSLFKKLEYDPKEQKSKLSRASTLENEVKIEPHKAIDKRPNIVKQKMKAFSKFSNYQPFPTDASM